jgi:hypothetical protein
MAKHSLARRGTQVIRRPVTSSPAYLKLADKVSKLRKRSIDAGKTAENPMLVLGGAAIPALYQRFAGRPLPTVMNLDPELLAGGLLMALSQMTRGHNRTRLLALGAGCAAPAINRSIKSGTVLVGDDGTDGETPSI